MPALDRDVKIYIVKALACFDAPSEVAKAVKLEFGIDATRQKISAYSPETSNGARLSDELKLIFAETRKKFLDDVSEIPIANQAYRLRALNRMFAAAEGRGNMALAAQILEQAAKETGGFFSNRRELTGKDGRPLQASPAVLQVIIEGDDSLSIH